MLAHEGDQSIVDLLGMGCRQEVLASLDHDKVGGFGVDEEFDFLFGVGHAVDRVVGALYVREGLSASALSCRNNSAEFVFRQTSRNLRATTSQDT